MGLDFLRVCQPVPKYLSLCSPALPRTATVHYPPLVPGLPRSPQPLPGTWVPAGWGSSRTEEAHGVVIVNTFKVCSLVPDGRGLLIL